MLIKSPIHIYPAEYVCLPVAQNLMFFFIFQAGRNIRDLFEDLRDGHNLLSLLEVLSGEILVSFESTYPFLVGKLGAYKLNNT